MCIGDESGRTIAASCIPEGLTSLRLGDEVGLTADDLGCLLHILPLELGTAQVGEQHLLSDSLGVELAGSRKRWPFSVGALSSQAAGCRD